MDSLRVSRRSFLQTAITVGAGGLLNTSGVSAAPSVTPQGGKSRYGGTLTFGLSSDPPNLDPQVNTGVAATDVKVLVYNNLVRYWRKGEIAPDLAEAWSHPDNKTYIFKLRQGVKFHDGADFSAQDVEASIKRILDPKTGASRRTAIQDVSQIAVEDAYTVRLGLARPNEALIAHLARPECAIMSKRFLDSGSDPNTKMVGTGPFRFVSREPGVRIILERNADYFRKGLPYLDKVVFVPYADENTRVTAIRAGDVDFVEYVPWKDTAALLQTPRLQVFPGPQASFMYLGFNVREKPFNDPRVRRAVSYAINRQNVLDSVFFKRGSTMTGGLIPEGYWAYDPDLRDTYGYNTGKAKALLREAGYESLRVKLLATSQYGMHQGTAQVVQNDLRKIDVQADLDLYDWPTVVQKRNKSEFQFYVNGADLDVTDPDILTQYFYTGSFYSNQIGFSDPEVDKLLDAGRVTLDRKLRKRIYDMVQRRILEVAPFALLTWREQSEAALGKVKGYEHLPGGLWSVSAITLEEVYLEKS